MQENLQICCVVICVLQEILHERKLVRRNVLQEIARNLAKMKSVWIYRIKKYCQVKILYTTETATGTWYIFIDIFISVCFIDNFVLILNVIK